jgi:hypothetical protein
MQHFARVVNGVVEQVIAIEAEVLATGHWGDPSEWIETCSCTYGNVHRDGGVPLRKNHAQVGGTYDPEKDAFIPPRPFASWVLNEETCLWEAPIPRPEDATTPHMWDESTLSWIAI